MTTSKKRLASIDIGTNSVLLLIAEFREGRLQTISDLAQTTRLGKKVAATGEVSAESAAKTMAVLTEYADLIRTYQVDQVQCFSTAVLRNAQNAPWFQDQVKQQFGWDMRILTGQEEAFFTFVGALDAVQIDAKGAIAVDIGGGSTELVYGNAKQIQYEHSFPVGAVLLKETFSVQDSISPTLCQEMNVFLSQHFQTIPQPPSGFPTLVTGGTATTLAALVLQLTSYDIQKIEGCQLTRSQIEAIYAKLNSLSISERAVATGMEAGRADIIVPAVLLLLNLMQHLNTDTITVTVKGARYGILLSPFAD